MLERAAAVLILLDEGFDGVTAGEAGALPEGWVAARGHSAAPAPNVSFVHRAWVTHVSPQDSYGKVVVSTSWFSPARQADEWLFTPPVVLPATGTCVVDWRAFAADESYLDGYEVRVSTGGATIAAGLVDAPIFSTAAGHAEWSSLTASLDGYAGQTVRVAFRNNSDDKFLLYLDQIRVRCDSSTAFPSHRGRIRIRCD